MKNSDVLPNMVTVEEDISYEMHGPDYRLVLADLRRTGCRQEVQQICRRISDRTMVDSCNERPITASGPTPGICGSSGHGMS